MSSGRKENNGKTRTRETPRRLVSLDDYRRSKLETLTKRGQELRAQKTKETKEQIEEGTYYVEAIDVAKSVVRSEVTRLLGGKRPNRGTRRKP
jgi:anti-sigma28 factor (negative regulator of flagellin synthesis)